MKDQQAGRVSVSDDSAGVATPTDEEATDGALIVAHGIVAALDPVEMTQDAAVTQLESEHASSGDEHDISNPLPGYDSLGNVFLTNDPSDPFA